jgi:hypothetical protein
VVGDHTVRSQGLLNLAQGHLSDRCPVKSRMCALNPDAANNCAALTLLGPAHDDGVACGAWTGELICPAPVVVVASHTSAETGGGTERVTSHLTHSIGGPLHTAGCGHCDGLGSCIVAVSGCLRVGSEGDVKGGWEATSLGASDFDSRGCRRVQQWQDRNGRSFLSILMLQVCCVPYNHGMVVVRHDDMFV